MKKGFVMNNLYVNPQTIETNELIPAIQIWKSATNVKKNNYLSADELVKLIMISDSNDVLKIGRAHV